MSHDDPTVSARFVYGSTATHAGSATIHPVGATNAYDVATIRYSVTTVQADSATAASRSPTNVHDLAVVMPQVNRDVSDTPIHFECTRMAMIPPTVPPRFKPDSSMLELQFRPRP